MTPTLTVTDAMIEAGEKAYAHGSRKKTRSFRQILAEVYLAMHNARTPASPTRDDVERVAEAMAKVIGDRHGNTMEYWMSDARCEEARAAIAALAAQGEKP